MREILFRGKRIDNGEWIEGHLLEQDYPCYKAYIVPYINIEQDNRHTDILEHMIYEVDPATVGQYTGVEAHGKKIFEGDIVEYNGRRYCAKYYPPFAMYMFSRKSCGTNGTLIPLHECVVIGNIHDNPELLEG